MCRRERSQLRTEALCRGTAKRFTTQAWIQCSIEDLVSLIFTLPPVFWLFFFGGGVGSCMVFFLNHTIQHHCWRNLSSYRNIPPGADNDKESAISFYFRLDWNVYIIRGENDRPPCLQRQRTGEHPYNCSRMAGPLFSCLYVLPFFVSAETSDSIQFLLLLKKTLLCSFSADGDHLGAIKQCLGNVLA